MVRLIGRLPRSNDAAGRGLLASRERSRCRFSGFTNPAYPLRVQRQAHEQACHRACSGVTQRVNMIEG